MTMELDLLYPENLSQVSPPPEHTNIDPADRLID